ncbi:MAG: hypothetical protein LBC20_03550, partial [Planctomycetaceae bacterium]|nr:hypothetical protein [Planctomycetaceae bacterium]
LIPFFITVIIIISAIPFVRVYSVPYISLDEIEALLDKTNIAERLSPEERKALFRATASRLTQKITFDDYYNGKYLLPLYGRYSFLTRYYPNTNNQIKVSFLEQLKYNNIALKEKNKLFPFFEVWILYEYEMKNRIINGGADNTFLSGNLDIKKIVTQCRYLPWEKTRNLRRFNWQLRSHIYLSCTNWTVCPLDNNAEQKRENERKRIVRKKSFLRFFDELPPLWLDHFNYFDIVNSFRLGLVHNALNIWYLEHSYTLPKSLDELVGKYLDEIPHDPQTGAIMEYYPKSEESSKESENNVSNIQKELFTGYSSNDGLDKPGWCLKLGSTVIELQFQTPQEVDPVPE